MKSSSVACLFVTFAFFIASLTARPPPFVGTWEDLKQRRIQVSIERDPSNDISSLCPIACRLASCRHSLVQDDNCICNECKSGFNKGDFADSLIKGKLTKSSNSSLAKNTVSDCEATCKVDGCAISSCTHGMCFGDKCDKPINKNSLAETQNLDLSAKKQQPLPCCKITIVIVIVIIIN